MGWSGARCRASQVAAAAGRCHAAWPHSSVRAHAGQCDLPAQSVSAQHVKTMPELLCHMVPPPAGSMYGARETVAKAVALECMRGAHRQQRKCYLYAFRWVTDAAAARRCIARSRPDGMPQLAGSPAHFMHNFGGICGLKFSLLVWLVPAAAPATLLSWSWAPMPPPSPTSSSSSRPVLAAAQVGGGDWLQGGDAACVAGR